MTCLSSTLAVTTGANLNYDAVSRWQRLGQTISTSAWSTEVSISAGWITSCAVLLTAVQRIVGHKTPAVVCRIAGRWYQRRCNSCQRLADAAGSSHAVCMDSYFVTLNLQKRSRHLLKRVATRFRQLVLGRSWMSVDAVQPVKALPHLSGAFPLTTISMSPIRGPLNPKGELFLGLKFENKRALANVEITAQVPGIAFAGGIGTGGYEYVVWLQKSAESASEGIARCTGSRLCSVQKRWHPIFRKHVP